MLNDPFGVARRMEQRQDHKFGGELSLGWWGSLMLGKNHTLNL